MSVRLRRFNRIREAIFSGIALQAITILVSFISLTVTVRYLGSERYGVWTTISTGLIWVTLFDFGLANGLIHALAKTTEREDAKDEARCAVSTAFLLLSIVAVVNGVILAVLWRAIDWPELFNITDVQMQVEVKRTIAVTFVLFGISFPLSIVEKIYTGLQERAKANYWLAIGNLLSIVGLLTAMWLRGGLPSLALASFGLNALVKVFSGIWLLTYDKPLLKPSFSDFDLQLALEFLRFGSLFFLIQLAALLFYQTDNLIIIRRLGPAAVTPYAITFRLFSYSMMLQNVIFPAMWPAISAAYEERDGKWISQALRYNYIGNLLLVLPLVCVMIIFGDQILQIWLNVDWVVSKSLLYWMGAFSVVRLFVHVTSTILNAIGKIEWFAVLSITAAASNIFMSIWGIDRFGTIGVIASSTIAMTFLLFIPIMIQARRELRKLTEGNSLSYIAR